MSDELPEPLATGDPDIELRKWALLAALHDNLDIEPDTTILTTADNIHQWLKTGVIQGEI